MNKNAIWLTTAQFAKLHQVNKRTLLYYDEIGLFSPQKKGENNYRYYNLSQSLDFEYIRMLKELKMSLNEIQAYLEKPSASHFLQLAYKKEAELEKQIQRLTQIKKELQHKKEQILFCETLEKPQISLVTCPQEALLMVPYDFAEDSLSHLFSTIKEIWSSEQIRRGVGSYIAVEKLLQGDFENYDGLYTPALSPSAKAILRPAGQYLCAYQKGEWEQLPSLYQKMFTYAQEKGLTLTGYAYEMGLNEFVLETPADYVTQIMIKIAE